MNKLLKKIASEEVPPIHVFAFASVCFHVSFIAIDTPGFGKIVLEDVAIIASEILSHLLQTVSELYYRILL